MSLSGDLRELADLIDDRPVFAAALETSLLKWPAIGMCEIDPARFAALVAELPGTVTYETKGTVFYARSDRGFYVYGPVSALCERTQVGVEPVFDYVLKPAAILDGAA